MFEVRSITVDCHDPYRQALFWTEVTGWQEDPEDPNHPDDPEGRIVAGQGFSLLFIPVPEGKVVKNRMHLDLLPADRTRDEEVTRLLDIGATLVEDHRKPDGRGWVTLADPEGNEFCVLEPRPVYQDTGLIAAVVVDCSDPRAMARFWGEAMDWTVHEVTDQYSALRSAASVGPYLEFLRVPDVKIVKNRTHLDLRPYPGDDQAAEVARLRALGATDIDVGQGDDVSWTCLADPEGNEFDVLTPR